MSNKIKVYAEDKLVMILTSHTNETREEFEAKAVKMVDEWVRISSHELIIFQVFNDEGSKVVFRAKDVA